MIMFDGAEYNSKAEVIRHLAGIGALKIESPSLKNFYAIRLGMTPQTVHATLKAMNEGKKSLTKSKPFTMADEIPVLVRQKIVDKVYWCFEKTNFLLSNPDMPSMEWNLKGAVAGKYKYGVEHGKIGCLCWHPQILARNEEHYINRTVPHEVAHYIVRQVWGFDGIKSHGKEWQTVMQLYGLTHEATHNYDLSGIKRDRSPFIYKCSCREIKIGPKRHTKIQSGRHYFCNLCRSRISFLRKEERA